MPAGVKRFIVIFVYQTRTSAKKRAAKRNTATAVKATSCVTHFVQNAHAKDELNSVIALEVISLYCQQLVKLQSM